MDYFRNFDQLRTTELFVVRNGFWCPQYELTDGQFSYAKLSYPGIFQKSAVIEAAGNTWLLKRKGLMSMTFFINSADEMNIGLAVPATWSRNVQVTMNDGFAATFIGRNMFSCTQSLISDQYGDILQIKQNAWSWKNPFKITVDTNLLKSIPALPLLVLLGVHFVILKQSQAAVAAGS